METIWQKGWKGCNRDIRSFRKRTTLGGSVLTRRIFHRARGTRASSTKLSTRASVVLACAAWGLYVVCAWAIVTRSVCFKDEAWLETMEAKTATASESNLPLQNRCGHREHTAGINRPQGYRGGVVSVVVVCVRSSSRPQPHEASRLSVAIPLNERVHERVAFIAQLLTGEISSHSVGLARALPGARRTLLPPYGPDTFT